MVIGDQSVKRRFREVNWPRSVCPYSGKLPPSGNPAPDRALVSGSLRSHPYRSSTNSYSTSEGTVNAEYSPARVTAKSLPARIARADRNAPFT